MTAKEAKKAATKAAIYVVQGIIDKATANALTEVQIPDEICFTDNVKKHFKNNGYDVSRDSICWCRVSEDEDDD